MKSLGVKFLIRAMVMGTTVISLAACLENGEKDKCSEPFEQVISSVKILGGKNVYFNINDFDFLLDNNIVIEEISLQGELDDKGDEPEDFSFDINGIKAVRKDGGKHIELDRKKGCRYKSPVHKFWLNGGVPFSVFMGKVKLNKGQLILNLHAKKSKVLEAQIVVRGKKYVKCDTPPPPPPPPAVAPDTIIDAVNPVGAVVNSANMTINFSSDQANVTFWCQLDGAAASTCSSPISYSSVANGDHSFRVYAVNAAGLADVTPASYSWNVDTVPPSVTIDNSASLPILTNQTSITFLFSSNEVGTFTCSLDGGNPVACSSPATFNNLSEGAHNISINVVDNAGNPSLNPATYNWAVDLTAPVASILNASPSAAVNNSSTMAFEFAANESANFECSIDNGAYGSCASPLSINGVSEGPHWFNVRAIDVAGNIGLPASYAWNTDLTAPVITITNTVPAQGLTNSHNVFVEFSVSENASVTCTWDGVAAPCTSPFSSEAGEGNHTLEISAQDLAGNTGASVSLNWTMDFTNPVLSWGNILPSPSAYLNSGDVSLEVVPSEIVTFTTSLNGVDVNQGTSPVVFSNLAEGAYTVVVVALDPAGNPSSSISHTFTVDVIAPVLNVVSAINGLTNLDNNTITFGANESVNFVCNIDQAGFAACASPLVLSGLADGNHHVEIKATDLAGNASDISNVDWMVDTVAPTTSVTPSQLSRTSFSFNLSANESPVTFLCSLDGGAFANCNTPVTYNLAQGNHTFAARAVDAAGNTDNVGASVTVTVLPAILTSITSATANGNTNVAVQTINFTSNHVNASFTCSLDGAAYTSCTSPVTYNSLAEGGHFFTVKATDQWGTTDNTGATHVWTKDTIAPATSLVTTQNNHNTFTFSLSSNEAGTFVCSIDGGAYVGCTSPLNYTATAGSHTIAVRAVDLAGNMDLEGASDIFTAYPELSTIINSATSTNITNFSSQTINFSSSVSGSTFKCALDNAVMTACTSPVSYTGLADGVHTFNVRAIAPWGQEDTVGASVTWTIDTVAPFVISTSFSTTSTTATINWTTNEGATSGLLWGITPNTNNTVADDGVYKTSHSIKLLGLSPNTSYNVRPVGHDQAGNQYIAGPFSVRTGR